MAERARPEPPPERGAPALIELPPARWWRVHVHDPLTGRFAPHAFNASSLGDARFSPLRHGGAAVPVLYAAATLEAALMETVLHDVPYPSAGHIHDLPRDLGGPLHASQLEMRVALQLVDLTKLGLQRMGLRPSQMFETDADDYPRTRRWAEYFHRDVGGAGGLLWMSSRQPEARALMLFAGSFDAGAVRPIGEPQPLRHTSVQQVLLALLHRLGCDVAPDY